MDAKHMRRLKPKLTKFLRRFDDCFGRKDTRAHLPVYVQGQLSDLPDKSVEPIATKAGVAPRTLQEFLTHLTWDQERMRDRVQEIVRSQPSGPPGIGLIDETSFAKKGDKTPGVQRQWCGSEGKKDNCLVTVPLGFARDDFHCLLDGELFLPESWSQDRERCREAGIPDSVVYRAKWVIALELYDHARGNGLTFDWLTFDENYGGKPEFLRGLSARQQCFVGEVPRHFTGWLKAPRVTTRPFRRRGRGRRVPRVVSGSRPVQSVADMLHSRTLRQQPWQRWRVKDGEKGPMVWEVKPTRFVAKDANGLPGQRLHLLVARNVLRPEEIKFFVSNAPPETAVPRLLLVAFSRWRVERCFEDQKGEVGLDHYEGRRYVGLKRHLVVSAVSYLFLAQTRQELGGEKTGTDGMPAQHGVGGLDPVLVAGATAAGQAAGAHRGGSGTDPATASECSQEPQQSDAAPAAGVGHKTYRVTPLQMGVKLAL